ncbi:MAG: nitroreductase/quinone reductase family protein [Actinomycetota bacterium]|nr:nitroreductase/quinone reductase family protein [Actinomycetota bacterium]
MSSRAVQELNDQMVDRLLHQQPQPLTEGGYALRVLEARGRRTGQVHRTPLGVLLHQGSQYLVCPDRSRDWVRNLAFHSDCLLSTAAGSELARASSVPAPLAVEVIASYLAVVTVPWATSAFGLHDDADLAEIEAALPRMAVFVLNRRDSTTSI